MKDLEWWAKSCLSKNRYTTKEFAKKVAKDIKEERGTDLRVYFCEECNGWHLSSSL